MAVDPARWRREEWVGEDVSYFYGARPERPHWQFSNFARLPEPIWLPLPFDPELGKADHLYAEHAFQAGKTTCFADFMTVWQASGPKEAKAAGRRVAMRADWEQQRAWWMLAVLREKFALPDFRAALVATGERILVEDSPSDALWGGRDKSGGYRGQNLLGRALMRVRAEIAAEARPARAPRIPTAAAGDAEAPDAGWVVHCKRSAYDVYIGRPSKWGNPFSHRADSRACERVATVGEAVGRYRAWVTEQPALMAALEELRGKVLGCWCKTEADPHAACHGDVLAELANAAPEARELDASSLEPGPRVIVCGSSTWDDAEAIERRLALLPASAVVLVGDEGTVDELARTTAERRGLETEVFPVRRGVSGAPSPGAQLERGMAMLESGAELVVACAAPTLEASHSTRHCVSEARRRGVRVELYESTPGQEALPLMAVAS